ncbi:MAG: hypothetical protein HOO97_11705 [Sideroxydans sp.]|nr:hypothetical protein [Sideroxydans sp.]
MKKVLVIALLSAFAATSAHAEGMSIGAAYGLGFGNLEVHGDMDISKLADNNPVKARVGYNRYSTDFGAGNFGYTWSYNIFYGGAYYDFNQVLKLDSKIHPFAGLGFGFGSTSCSGQWCGFASSTTAGGLYYIGGAQYDITPQIQAEVGYSGWSGIQLGANFKF